MKTEKYICIHGVEHTRKDLDRYFKSNIKTKVCWFLENPKQPLDDYFDEN